MGQILYAQADGNASAIDWNTAANGSGDSAPWGDHGEDDTLEANGKVVTLDIASFIRAALTNTGGGSFACNLAAVGAREFTCDLLAGTATLMWPQGATYPLRINGDVTASSATGSVRGMYVSVNGQIITINGDVIGGGAVGAHGIYYVLTGTTAVLTVLGTCRGGTAGGTSGIQCEGNSLLVANHVVGGATQNNPGVFRYVSGGRTCPTIIRGCLDFSQPGPPINGDFTWDPSPGACIITPTKRFYPSAATGILGVGV